MRLQLEISLIVAFCLLFAGYPALAQHRRANERWKTFERGVLFRIKYPKSFRSIAGMESPSGLDGDSDDGTVHRAFDSALFESPDRSVEFLVCVPWNEETIDQRYRSRQRHGVLVAHRQETKKYSSLSIGPGNAVPTTVFTQWSTFRALNGKFSWSWVDSDADQRGNGGYPTHIIFGIRYRDRASLRKYRARYTHFKTSLSLWSFCPM